jgi:hypothetical protein
VNWEWMVSQGLIAGDPNYYSSGKATADEFSNAIKTAYLNADDSNRRQLVDQLWSTGYFTGSKEYWYEDRSDEAGSLASAATKMAKVTGTGQEGAGARFSIAGGAELWKNTDTGESYIVYGVPDSEPPMFLRYTVPSESDLQSFFGPDQPIVYNRELPGAAVEWSQSLGFGTTDALRNTSENPFAAWSETLERAAETQPWLLEDDYQRLFAMSIIEGRQLEEWELQGTNYYQTHTEAQREWMRMYHADPMSAEQLLESRKITTAEYMRQNGLSDVDPRLSDYMAERWAMGDWSQQEVEWQTKVLTDPYFADRPMNTDLQKFIDDNDITYNQTADKETEVRDLVKRWLGTNFGQWSDDQVSEWAGRMRNETDAQEKLLNVLKDQKSALFPEYDREADYETIASPWRNMMRNMWGEVPDDSDTTLQQVIRMNNAGEAGKLMTEVGLQRGNDNVVNSVQSALQRSFA